MTELRESVDESSTELETKLAAWRALPDAEKWRLAKRAYDTERAEVVRREALLKPMMLEALEKKSEGTEDSGE